MPKLGLTMTEGVVAEWLLPPGGRFEKGQAVFVVETDKAANEIAAEHDGVLLEILHGQGETIAVGKVLAHWDDGAVEANAQVSRTARPPDSDSELAAPAEPALHPAAPSANATRIIATPLARKAAKRAGIELSSVAGSGPRGRIKAGDVTVAARPSTVRPATAPTAHWRRGSRVEPGKVAAAMARRLAKVKREVPHFFLAHEADVGPLLAMRSERIAENLPRISLTHLIVAAVGRALEEVPGANRVWADDAYFDLEASDVGVAVRTDRGLLVPVIRAAGRSTMVELVQQAQELIARTRAGTLRLDEMLGGAVTVSNAGRLGVSAVTPIINPGQSMVLGVGAVQPVFRPDAESRPLLRQELGLVLACDHRVFDGSTAIRFMHCVVDHLERPGELMTPT